jgi:hypothetical protein
VSDGSGEADPEQAEVAGDGEPDEEGVEPTGAVLDEPEKEVAIDGRATPG